MKNLEYRPDIDALRGVAVFLVVVYHAFPALIPGGFIGVDVFFVISGFLITTIMLLSMKAGEFSFKDFYSRRIRRLFPALVTVLLFSLVVGWLVLFPDEFKQLGAHVSQSVIFLLNFELINEIGYFDVESHYKPLLHLWSLSVEEQYYLVWPLIVYIFIKINIRLEYLFGAILLLSFYYSVNLTADNPQEAYYHTLARIWQLAVGSMLAVVLLQRKVAYSSVLTLLGVVLIGASAFMISSTSAYPGLIALLPVLGSIMILIFARGSKGDFLGFRQLGLISYPLYLWHWVLISFTYIYLGRQPENSIIVLVLFAAVLLSYLTYRYIEKLRYNKKTTLYLVFVFLLLGLIGWYVDHKDGFEDRNHIKYFVNSSIEFKRTPAKDDLCRQYSESVLGESELFDYCRAADLKQDKLIAIIGDSHAHVMFPGIREQASRHGFGTILLANSSCPVLKGFMWGRNHKEEALCQEKIDQILTVLERDRRIEKVLLSTRGPVYIHREVKGKFTEQSVDKSLQLIRTEEKQTYETYFVGYQNTMKQLDIIGHIKDVYYFLENPELDFKPKDVIPRPFDLFNVSTNRNYVSRDLYLRRMDIYRDNVSKYSWPKSKVLDPMEALCDEERCYTLKNNGFLYADDDHFSIHGSKFISDYFSNDIFIEGVK